jgi:hypothetical protein
MMSGDEVFALKKILASWAMVFPKSGNLAERYFNVPSSLVRFDYVMHDGVPCIYEVEERPAGLGVTSSIHPTFAGDIRRLFKKKEEVLQREIALYISPGRDGSSDDDVFSLKTGIPVVRGPVAASELQRNAWYVRSGRREEDVSQLFTEHSISTLRHEGDKSYGLHLGLWKEIGGPGDLDFSLPFVVKPRAGSRFEGVLLYHPDKKMGQGFATRTKVTDAVASGDVHFIQAYQRGEEAPFLGSKYHLIRRAYFVYSHELRDYVSLGGLWMATPTARVHGTSQAVSGVILPP